ncbi:MAG: TonB-dependent receptor [Saprospiraceae bacterium]|nr:TonB-dependent receptor [Saprospiraceae bacterium]
MVLKRFLAIYNMGYTMDGFFKNIDINANYQSVRESRHNRNFGSAALNHRIEDVTVVGLQISGVHKHERHDLRLGVDSYWNGVQSTASKENITNGVISPLNTRYPDGGNQQWTTSAYASHTMKINESFTLNDGVRLGYNALSSNFKDKSFFPFPFDEVGQNNFIYSANAGLIYQMTKGVRLSYLCALGFRTPNIDDLSKVFDSTPGIVIVPNPNLKPESTVSNEINIGYFDKSWSVENVIYYTHLSNFISLAPGTFNGQPQILYNDSLSAVYTSVNQARGYIYGFNSNIRKKLSHHMSVFGSLSYTYGRNKNGDQVSPLDHVAPLFGKIGMQYSDARLDGSFFVLYNGKKDIKDYSLSGEDNAQYAPLTGMPAWMTFNIRAGYNVSKVLKLQLGAENILDTQYRYFASGINAAGRNIWTTLRVSF